MELSSFDARGDAWLSAPGCREPGHLPVQQVERGRLRPGRSGVKPPAAEFRVAAGLHILVFKCKNCKYSAFAEARCYNPLFARDRYTTTPMIKEERRWPSA
jgi:hypothetical protein